MTAGTDESRALKNSPSVTPSADAMRSRDAIDGEAKAGALRARDQGQDLVPATVIQSHSQRLTSIAMGASFRFGRASPRHHDPSYWLRCNCGGPDVWPGARSRASRGPARRGVGSESYQKP